MTEQKFNNEAFNEQAFLWSGQAILRLIRIIKTGEADAALDLVGMLQMEPELEPYVLAKTLEAARVLGMAEAAGAAAGLLKHANPRVRANAVEVVALQPELAKEQLSLCLADANNRVYANVVRALSRLGVDFKKNSFKKQTSKYGSFSQSLLWLAADTSFDRLNFCNDLLVSANPHLRDKSFDLLKGLATKGDRSVLEVIRSVNKQLALYKESEDFFKNSLDRFFTRVLHLEQPKRSIFSKLVVFEDKEVEIKIINQIAEVARTKQLFPASITTDLYHIEKDRSLLASYLEYPYGAQYHRLKELLEQVIPEEMEILEARKYFTLECAVYDIFNIPNYQIKYPYLSTSLLNLKSKVGFVVPAEKFSIIPNEEMGVLEIFTLTLGLYQKHIWSFSKKTLLYALQAVGLILIPLAFILIDKLAFVTIFLLFLVFYVPHILKLFVRWQVVIVLMIRNFVHGIEHNDPEVEELATRNLDRVYAVARGKYLRILGFSLLSFVGTVFLVILGKSFPIGSFGYSFAYWLSGTFFSACFAWIYVRYLLVESVAVLAPKLDAIETAIGLFAKNRFKLILLFVVGGFLNEVVTQYSVDLLNYMVFLESSVKTGTTFLLTFVSSLCLAPIAFSNFTLYCMMKLRE